MEPVTITVSVIDGPDRGRVFPRLKPVISIGREEGNVVLLRDERVSRFHAKIYSTGDEIVITDLQSTNGTFVNGDPVRFAPLSTGDRIGVGRSLLLIHIHREGETDDEPTVVQPVRAGDASGVLETPTPDVTVSERLGADQTRAPLPDLPGDLTAGQAARLIRVFNELHEMLKNVIWSAEEDPATGYVRISREHWMSVLTVAKVLARYYRELVEPEGS